MTGIAPIPATYAGVRFRSTLEAEWAATLDSLKIRWQYEPIGLQLPSGTFYRPDFYLPDIATWLEVKGPGVEGLEKTRELAKASAAYPDLAGCQCPNGCPDDLGDCACGSWDAYQLVVIGLAPVGGEITSCLIDPATGAEDYDALFKCGTCSAWWWVGLNMGGSYGCRAHRRGGSGDDDLHNNSYGSPTFARLR